MRQTNQKMHWRMGLILLAITLISIGVTMRCISLAVADWNPEGNYIDADLIRVGISDDAMTAQEYPLTQISATGPFTIKDKTTGMLMYTGDAGDVVNVHVDRAGFYIKGKNSTAAKTAVAVPVPNLHLLAVPSNVAPAAIMPVPGPLVVEPMTLSNRLKVVNITRRHEVPEFRGTFEIVRGSSSPSKLSVVNVVSLEDYLKAVVPNELPMRYGVEAVKAQAVAARNYAVRPREKPWKTFDICDSQLCQVYMGSQTETPDSNRAIADTEGLVGLYNGDPILALFSSSHGGYAEDYSNAFSDPITKQYPAPPIAYLSGGPDIPMASVVDLHTEAGARKFWTNPNVRSFDVESPYYRWTRHWTRPELEAAITKGLQAVSKDTSTRDFVRPLLKPGHTIGTLKAINVLERGNSGKAMVVAIVGSKGTWRIEKEFLIRKVFNKNGKMLPSGNVVFTIPKSAKGALWNITANGGGFGHGVGLSQLGASWMSKHGYAFPKIIQHYYRGVSLGSLPISVGGSSSSNRPVMTRFDVTKAQGMLWVQEGDDASAAFGKQTPVTVKLNGQSVKLQPHGFRSGMALDNAYLKSDALNTLVLFPDASLSGRVIKAWVELYPAVKSTSVAAQ